MAQLQLIIAPAAHDDLREIYQYGLRHWGANQADRYLEALKGKLWSLTTQPLLGIERPELLKDLRSVLIERHVLFYRQNSHRLEVIRILHTRQDPMRHIQ